MLDALLATAATTTSTAPTGVGTDALLIGAIVALANAVTEAVKSYAARRSRHANGGASVGHCPECHEGVKRTLQIASQADSDGVPLVYSGHQVSKKLDRVADELASVARQLKKE